MSVLEVAWSQARWVPPTRSDGRCRTRALRRLAPVRRVPPARSGGRRDLVPPRDGAEPGHEKAAGGGRAAARPPPSTYTHSPWQNGR